MDLHEIIQETVKKILSSKFVPGSIHFVDVTHINDPGNFYIRPISVSEDVKVLEVRGEQLPEKELIVGKQVVYKSKILKKCVRGIILSIKKDKFNIFAMDYGCIDTHTSPKRIYSTHPNLQCPALAMPCQLALCGPLGKTYSDTAIKAMRNFTGKNTAEITITSISSNQKLTVELKTDECPGGVGQLLAMLNYTALASCVNTISRLTDTPYGNFVINYKYKKLEVGDCLYTRVQSGESINSFYVAEINDYKKYTSLKVDFKNYCVQQKFVEDIHEAVIDKRCCGVLVKRDYERAVVLRVIDPSTAVVKLVDLGGEIEAPIHCIKPVTSMCYNSKNACAIYCSAPEDQTWKNGLPKFLYPGYQFMIEIVELGNDKDIPHKVNIFPAS